MKKVFSVFIFLILAIILAHCFLTKDSEVTQANPANEKEMDIFWGKWNSQLIEELIQNSKKYIAGDRIDYISKKFLETPYKANTLNTNKDLPEKLIVNLGEMDCSTFLDYVVALSLSNNLSDFYEKLRLVRYENGEISFITRNHFFTQWIDSVQNIDNISNTFEKFTCEQKLLNKEEKWIKGIVPIYKEVCFIPKENFTESLKNGDLIGFYTNSEGLDVTHVGIISINEKILLRHASSKTNKIIEEPLEEYLKNNGRQGLIIARTKN